MAQRRTRGDAGERKSDPPQAQAVAVPPPAQLENVGGRASRRRFLHNSVTTAFARFVQFCDCNNSIQFCTLRLREVYAAAAANEQDPGRQFVRSGSGSASPRAADLRPKVPVRPRMEDPHLPRPPRPLSSGLTGHTASPASRPSRRTGSLAGTGRHGHLLVAHHELARGRGLVDELDKLVATYFLFLEQ